MSTRAADRLRLEVGGGGGSWWVEADLGSGRVRHSGTSRSIPAQLDAEALATLRAGAAEVHAAGDAVHRTQFILGEMHFIVTLGGETVTASVFDDGRRSPEPLETLYRILTG
ncbi:MAG: hypothetical protein KC486_06235 [Myxococcales bacterium]|nr:hypothetical protein [Myxococcales bacterium]